MRHAGSWREAVPLVDRKEIWLGFGGVKDCENFVTFPKYSALLRLAAAACTAQAVHIWRATGPEASLHRSVVTLTLQALLHQD